MRDVEAGEPSADHIQKPVGAGMQEQTELTGLGTRR